MAEGTPEEVATTAGSYTGEVLAPLLGVKRGKAKVVPSTKRSKATPPARPKPRGTTSATPVAKKRAAAERVGRKPVAAAKPAPRARVTAAP